MADLVVVVKTKKNKEQLWLQIPQMGKFQLVLVGRKKSKLKLWLQGLKMGKLQTISS
jgi:hypothetical protein